jgi:GTP-binding protein EngB required for normal cell division
MRYVDMPGFGFMSGMPYEKREQTKDRIIQEVEANMESIDLAMLILDAGAFVEICERWDLRGEIPIDVEMHDFLSDLDIPLLVVANRMDKVENPDATLDAICERLDYLPPWRQWVDVIVPTSAKTGDGIDILRRTISKKLGLN